MELRFHPRAGLRLAGCRWLRLLRYDPHDLPKKLAGEVIARLCRRTLGEGLSTAIVEDLQPLQALEIDGPVEEDALQGHRDGALGGFGARQIAGDGRQLPGDDICLEPGAACMWSDAGLGVHH